MSKLTELIEELCPDGVEYRPLAEHVLNNLGGGTPSKSKAEYWGGTIPWASVGDVNAAGNQLDTTRARITELGLDKSSSKLVPAGNVIVALKISPGATVINTVDVAINQDLRGLILDEELDGTYLMHYLRTQKFSAHGTIVKSITNKSLMGMKIPVPPLAVQQEIVRVLDAFTDLEQSLVAELELREKQFEEYRRNLLENLAGVEYRPLGEVVQIRNGRDWKTQEPGDIPVYGSGGRMQQTVAMASTEGASVLLPRKGSLEVQYVEEPIWNVDTVFTTVCDAEVLNTRFFYFAMKSVDLGRISTSATRPSLTQSALRKVLIPVLPLEEQQEIVDKLDAFESLIHSIEQEIALRRKQYEFYRDELLSFMPKEA